VHPAVAHLADNDKDDTRVLDARAAAASRQDKQRAMLGVPTAYTAPGLRRKQKAPRQRVRAATPATDAGPRPSKRHSERCFGGAPRSYYTLDGFAVTPAELLAPAIRPDTRCTGNNIKLAGVKNQGARQRLYTLLLLTHPQQRVESYGGTVEWGAHAQTGDEWMQIYLHERERARRAQVPHARTCTLPAGGGARAQDGSCSCSG
jgi:hypothetical protein